MEHDAIRGTEVLLKGSKDWERWLALIRSKAIHEEVWDYVNPDTDALDLPVFEPPSAPTSSRCSRQPYCNQGQPHGGSERVL